MIVHFIYLYILLLYRLTVPLSISPGKLHILSKVSIIALKSREAAEPVFVLRLLPGGAASSPNVINSNGSALAFHLRLQKPMNFDHHFFDFSKSHWELHFSYGFDIALTFDHRCDPWRVSFFSQNQNHHILPTNFQCFYVDVTRCCYNMVSINSTHG